MSPQGAVLCQPRVQPWGKDIGEERQPQRGGPNHHERDIVRNFVAPPRWGSWDLGLSVPRVAPWADIGPPLTGFEHPAARRPTLLTREPKERQPTSSCHSPRPFAARGRGPKLSGAVAATAKHTLWKRHEACPWSASMTSDPTSQPRPARIDEHQERIEGDTNRSPLRRSISSAA